MFVSKTHLSFKISIFMKTKRERFKEIIMYILFTFVQAQSGVFDVTKKPFLSPPSCANPSPGKISLLIVLSCNFLIK